MNPNWQKNCGAVRQSLPFFQALLARGMERIEEGKRTGFESYEKGVHSDGTSDPVTSLDIEVGNLYARETRHTFPEWRVVSEDGGEEAGSGADGLASLETRADVFLFFDPLDGTYAFKNGYDGYSSMLTVTVRSEEGIYLPVLGVIQTPQECHWGFHDYDEAKESNIRTPPQKKTSDDISELSIMRGKSDRYGYIKPICEALGGKQQIIHGMAGKASGILCGEYGLFVQGPNMGFWDVLPLVPMFKAHGAPIRDWLGREFAYRTGEQRLTDGVLGAGRHVPFDAVLEKIQKVYPGK